MSGCLVNGISGLDEPINQPAPVKRRPCRYAFTLSRCGANCAKIKGGSSGRRRAYTILACSLSLTGTESLAYKPIAAYNLMRRLLLIGDIYPST
jgi:hypothetical protein